MKKIIFILAVFLLISAFTVSAESSIRSGKSAVSAHLVLGKNNEDSIAQVGASYEYGIISHLSAGLGYVYVDGRHPIQAHGLDLFIKVYVFDTIFDLYGFDIYGKASTQIYSQDSFGLAYTLLSGLEWQSPFKMFISFEGGGELENGDWGYLYGAVLGLRL
jgi:hypothetical protein